MAEHFETLAISGLFNSGAGLTFIVIIVAMLVVISGLAIFASRYKRCPPNRILVKYGKSGGTGPAQKGHRGGGGGGAPRGGDEAPAAWGSKKGQTHCQPRAGKKKRGVVRGRRRGWRARRRRRSRSRRCLRQSDSLGAPDRTNAP